MKYSSCLHDDFFFHVAWRNRHGDVVYGVNDFDEAGIYDFQIDVLRIAVSIRSHALTNEPSEEEIEEALKVFTNTYVQTVLNYKDNENALLFELTHKTTTGELRDFLYHTQRKKSKEKLMTKFCTRDAVTGQRHFIKGDVGVPHNDTRLATVPDDMAREIKQAFNESHYGATMMKMVRTGHLSTEESSRFWSNRIKLTFALLCSFCTFPGMGGTAVGRCLFRHFGCCRKDWFWHWFLRCRSLLCTAQGTR